MSATRTPCVIHVTGNWCDGYWWELVNSETGRTIRDGGPYHATRSESAATYAREDALEWAARNGLEVIRK